MKNSRETQLESALREAREAHECVLSEVPYDDIDSAGVGHCKVTPHWAFSVKQSLARIEEVLGEK